MDLNLDDFTPDQLVERVGWRPNYIVNSMVTTRNAVQPVFIPIISRSPSTFGLLSIFPLELLHLIFENLDFRSLSCLARVCHQAKAAVDALPIYRDLIKHAFPALVALGRTKVISFHPAASIYAALLTEKCVTCEQFGPFLFLLTAERCCWECLRKGRPRRMITGAMARNTFGLMPKDLRELPSMLSIPGWYLSRHSRDYKRKRRLFSLKQARARGIARYGSEEAMKTFVAVQNAVKSRGYETCEVLCLGIFSNLPIDSFCGMTSTEFPSLQPNNVLEKGVWCMGCRANQDNFNRTGILDEETRALLAGDNPHSGLRDLEYRARSKAAFAEHVRACKGAKDILRGLERNIEVLKRWGL